MDDNLFIEYINSPYEEPQDMLPKIDETMLTDMESSLETDFKNEYQHEDVTSILESIDISESIVETSHASMASIINHSKLHLHTIVVEKSI